MSDDKIRMIAITGGPMGGKSSTVNTLKDEFKGLITCVPEASTLLTAGGFPLPNKENPETPEWRILFQKTILLVQQSMEEAYQTLAWRNRSKLIVCDRGTLDGAAYLPGGVEEFCRLFRLNMAEEINRYTTIIHLESRAVSEPDQFGKEGNDCRFEQSAEQALLIEAATKKVWSSHQRRIIVGCGRGIIGKIAEVAGIIRFLLSEK